MKRKWIRGANGLWTTFDPGHLKDKGAARARAVRERMAALIEREGWVRRGSRWRLPSYWQVRDAEKAAREERRQQRTHVG